MARLRVLVVEGDQSTRQLVNQTLTQQGYDVVEAENAEKGLQAMRPAKDQRAIDVVLCNRHIQSKKEGDPVLQFLAHRPAVPVVMLADEADLHYATQMFRQGVVDYLVKPIQSNALIDVIRHAIDVSKPQSRT